MSDNSRFRVLGWIGVSKSIQQVLERHVIGTPNGITPSCLSCKYFEEQSEICDAYKARPPARIIAFACPTYKDKDDIPFDFPPAKR